MLHRDAPAPPPPRKTSIGWFDPRADAAFRALHGSLLWPARFAEEDITSLERILGSYASAGQLQQRPAPKGGGLVKTEWWQYYDPSTLPVHFDEVLQSWDCAFKDLATSDYVVGQVWARSGANYYLLDMERGRMNLPATMRAVESMSNLWPAAVAKLVEDKANGPAVIQMLKDKLDGLIAVTPEGGKVARASAVTPIIESGNVYLPRNAKWLQTFLDEWAAFPRGSHDDCVDSCTQALNRLRRSSAGQFLGEFRPFGPRLSDGSIHANHIVVHSSSAPLQDWWHRWISLTWSTGKSYAHWYCQNGGDGRVHVYRELTMQGASAAELGAAVMEACMGEVGVDENKSITLWMPKDQVDTAIGRKSTAQQVYEGITAVLGAGTCFLWANTEDEVMIGNEKARWQAFERRRLEMKDARVSIQPAVGDEVGAWEYTRNLMRWWPLIRQTVVEYNRATAVELLSQSDGTNKYREYMRAVEGRVDEVLPKIVIHDTCEELIECLSTLVRDQRPTHANLPVIDEAHIAASSLLCGMIAHRGEQKAEPMSSFAAKRIEAVEMRHGGGKLSGTELYAVARKAEQDWASRNRRTGFRFARIRKAADMLKAKKTG